MSVISSLKKYMVILCLFLIVIFVSSIFPVQKAQADPPKKSSAHMVKKAPATRHKSFLDSRFHHNRSYPLKGEYYGHLPSHHRVVRHHNARYYAHDGVWYRYHGGRYVVVAPPVGMIVPFLPLAYATIWISGIPYYYANDTYYTRTPGGYVVVEPPQGDVRETAPDIAEQTGTDTEDDKMFIYPRQGQSQEQQDYDRYACHQWAVEQTRYDPTKVPSGISQDQVMPKRADYQKAMTECLDSRGYTAK
ncbi:MAG TPA: DUF6515 family protein [Smithella sp.]|nr:DUF6515 family protein [Smithella sp.]HOG89414.1 DUF6515 family protein [Smithella sp.]HQH16173.1 DUF6515 family protein [Smithella sp.]